jgi:hypothetical protein
MNICRYFFTESVFISLLSHFNVVDRSKFKVREKVITISYGLKQGGIKGGMKRILSV